MDAAGARRNPLLVLMKGHPGTGKSTLANALARNLGCPLIDKDDVRDCTTHLEAAEEIMEGATSKASLNSGLVPPAILNELSYQVMWRVAATQLSLGLTVIVDSPLSSLQRFEEAKQIAAIAGARIVVIECAPSNEAIWKERVENRASAAVQSSICPEAGTCWHKPSSWADIQRLLDRYQGCWKYDFGPTSRLVLDTSRLTSQDLFTQALNFVRTQSGRDWTL